MTDTDIISAAVLEEAKKYGLIDEILFKGFPKDLDEKAAALSVVNGTVSRVAIQLLVGLWRERMPQYFNAPDAAKLSDADFAKLEADLREPERREGKPLPGFIRKIDASQLSEDENASLRVVICGDKSTYHLGVVERAARRQGIDVAPVAA
jgi:hypothetical protein